MSLRGRIPDAESLYADPVLGVNLHKSEEDLQPGESSNMTNMIHYGRTQGRQGMTRITATQVAASYRVRAGHKYYSNPVSGAVKKRLIAYNTFVSTISDAGTEAKIWSTLTTDLKVDFNTWSITDSEYICNGTDDLLVYDGTIVGPVGATNIRSTVYRWISSPAQANEFYCELAAGGDPNVANVFADPSATGGIYVGGTGATAGTVGSLAAGEWDWGNNDTLGFNTIYVRLSDNSDPDAQASGYIWLQLGATVPGVTTSPAASQTIGVLDRLFAITPNGIERTDPRDPTVWSVDSSWATFRPSQSGTFKAMRPHVFANTDGAPTSGAIAATESAYYFFTGTDFGDAPVSAASPPTGENSSIIYVDAVGAYGPKSMTTVPGLGTFWLTPTKNVFFVPQGRVNGTFVGTRIVNTGGSSTTGLEDIEVTLGTEAWLVYSEPYLMLGYVPTGGTYVSRQYWLDLNKFRQDQRIPIWYGPMTGQTLGAVWSESAQQDNATVAGESNPTTGVFVYNVQVPVTYSDSVGTADNAIACELATYVKSGGAPSREKLVQGIEVEMTTTSGIATADIADLSGTILSAIPLEKTFT